MDTGVGWWCGAKRTHSMRPHMRCPRCERTRLMGVFGEFLRGIGRFWEQSRSVFLSAKGILHSNYRPTQNFSKSPKTSQNLSKTHWHATGKHPHLCNTPQRNANAVPEKYAPLRRPNTKKAAAILFAAAWGISEIISNFCRNQKFRAQLLSWDRAEFHRVLPDGR